MSTTESTTRTHERRRWSAEAGRRGWRHSTTAYRCPGETSGRPCGHRPEIGYPGCCVCAGLRERGALDHARRWSDRTGRPVVTAEVYDWDDERTVEIQSLCADYGIDVEVGRFSPYHPGRTTLLIYRGSAG